MIVQVCAGSSCHVHGSYGVLEKLKQLVTSAGLNDQIKVQISFCLGQCKDGVCMKVDDRLVTGVTEENIEEIFRTQMAGVCPGK